MNLVKPSALFTMGRAGSKRDRKSERKGKRMGEGKGQEERAGEVKGGGGDVGFAAHRRFHRRGEHLIGEEACGVGFAAREGGMSKGEGAWRYDPHGADLIMRVKMKRAPQGTWSVLG